MPYVARDKDGAISEMANRIQPGRVEEFMDADNPELVAFLSSPPPLTLDEIYDQTIQNQRLLKALVLCLNDGSIVPGANVSGADLKTAIKAKM